MTITVNGRRRTEAVPPRMHLADFVRERLNLTGTHLRCEQGVCGACTMLLDGQPVRSCITYAVMCAGAAVDTIEAFQDDAVMAALRRAFSAEHALQCGFCTPGMLLTARDIVLRLSDATPERVRLELSGNLCRCTGYVGIVRAIVRVLRERRAGLAGDVAFSPGPIGPLGARPGGSTVAHAPRASAAAVTEVTAARPVATATGLAGRTPNLEIRHAFAISRPASEVWASFADPVQVVTSLPGASITRVHGRDEFEGRMAVRLGPITANFSGRATISRDDARRAGVIAGAGSEGSGGARAAGEVAYVVHDTGAGTARIELTIRALLAGPLAQFGRAGIVEALVIQLTERFAANLEARISGAEPRGDGAPLHAGRLLFGAVAARIRSVLAGLSRSGRS